jgi:hypothetical protein
MVAKHQNITLSLPADLNALLHAKFPRRGMSGYVTKVLREALEKDSAKELQALEAAYEDAEKDPARKKFIKEWDALDTSDEIEGWEW